jgi:hypothetical protein
MRILVASLRKLPNVRCHIVEDPALKSRLSVFIDPRCQVQDPLDLNTARATPSLSREAMLGGAAGAVMLELSVAFVGIAPQPARASELPAVHNLRVRPEVRFALPAAAPGHDYVRLAYGPPEDNKASDQLKALQQTGPEYNQHVIDTPQTVVPPVVQPQPSSAPVDPVIRQQQEINAIRAEKPPPNATQDQLNQWQQNQQKQIQDILSGKSQ